MAYDMKLEWWNDVGRGAKGGPKQGTPKAKPEARTGHKICSQCGQEKPDGDFYFTGGKPKQPRKECSREYRNRHYLDIKSVRQMDGKMLRRVCVG